MKVLISIAILLLASSAIVRGQCTASVGFVCITQTQSNRIAKDLDELKAARDLIVKLKAVDAATDVERMAWKNYQGFTEAAIAVLQKGIADREAVIALQQKALELYATLVDRLTAEINKPKTAWQKFITTLRDIALLAGGIAIGRAGL